MRELLLIINIILENFMKKIIDLIFEGPKSQLSKFKNKYKKKKGSPDLSLKLLGINSQQSFLFLGLNPFDFALQALNFLLAFFTGYDYMTWKIRQPTTLLWGH